jgi:hypothetical protein
MPPGMVSLWELTPPVQYLEAPAGGEHNQVGPSTFWGGNAPIADDWPCELQLPIGVRTVNIRDYGHSAARVVRWPSSPSPPAIPRLFYITAAGVSPTKFRRPSFEMPDLDILLLTR